MACRVYEEPGESNDILVADADAVVNQVVGMLQNCKFVTANEVVKGGSLGHGTTVPGNFDADLVLYSESITVQIMLTNGNEPQSARWWAVRLNNSLQSKFSPSQMPDYEKMNITEHGVQFKITPRNGKVIKCDLLMSPWWRSQDQLLQYFSGQAARGNLEQTLKMFSASASKWQVQFIKVVPEEVKQLIKRAKKWRNDKWCSGELDIGKPKSYLMSILVIHACWNYATQRGYQSLKIMVDNERFTDLASNVNKIIKSYVKSHRTLKLSWLGFKLPQDQLTMLQKYQHAAAQAPYIPDPANPFNNLYLTGVGHYDPRRHSHRYGDGYSKWVPFVYHVESLDLAKAMQ